MRSLYVATDGTLCKIGISSNPAKRMRQHGKNVRLIEAWERSYAPELERHIKGLLAYCCARGSEWFAITLDELLFEVRRAIRIYDDEQAIRSGKEPSPRLSTLPHEPHRQRSAIRPKNET